MVKATPITTNIMSFKTFRSPDKIDYNEREEFFIHHPDLLKSKFNSCPLPNAEGTVDKRELAKFLNSFESVKNYKEIRAINPEFYDYSCLLMQQKKNDSSKKQLTAKRASVLEEGIILRIWDELFFQIATRESKSVRQACIQLLITQYYLTNKIDLKEISKLTVVIADIVLECFKPWTFEECSGKLFGVHNLGIQEYRRVEQTLCCYVPGEVSHIENIMAKEYKEKSTRNYLRTESTTEFTSETEIENINDTTSTERNEISSEIARIQQKDKSFDISGSVTVSKDSKVFGSIAANVSSGYSSNNSSALSNTEAKNYAKEVTERALERVVQKTTEKRTYKMIKEFEENNKHGYDNRGDNAKHITGVYRWVDKIYDNELVNYGKRLLFEADIPQPALLYKKAMEWKKKTEETASTGAPTAPKTLEDFGIDSATDLDSQNANLAAGSYGTSILGYESETQYVSVDIPVTEVSNKSHSQTQTLPSITIPPGLIAERIDGVGSINYKTTTGSAYIEFDFSGNKSYNGDWKDKGTKNFDYHFVLSPQLAGSISFVVRYRRANSYSGSLKVKCISDPVLFTEWQNETYLELQLAYQKKLDQYNEELKLQEAALNAENNQSDEEGNTNPAFNRLIEERELKRICIEMMSKPYCYDFGKRFYECKTYKCETECGENEAVIPQVVQNQELEKYAEFIKFFESAFQWEILTYVFYPYYYNQKCDWPELLQTKNNDPIFEAFLQSGMAKLLVPVRPQYEKAVMHYMETGEIYLDGDLVPETDDDRYLSLLKELGDQDEIKVEDTWKTRVPSALTIIQANSTYLKDEQGLPCCDEEGSVFESREDKLESSKTE